MRRSLKYRKNKRQSTQPMNREFKEAVKRCREEENKTDNLKQDIMKKIKCINCEWEGNEEELVLIEYDVNDDAEIPTAIEITGTPVRRYSPEPKERDFMKGCPTCETDHFLMDIN